MSQLLSVMPIQPNSLPECTASYGASYTPWGVNQPQVVPLNCYNPSYWGVPQQQTVCVNAQFQLNVAPFYESLANTSVFAITCEYLGWLQLLPIQTAICAQVLLELAGLNKNGNWFSVSPEAMTKAQLIAALDQSFKRLNCTVDEDEFCDLVLFPLRNANIIELVGKSYSITYRALSGLYGLQLYRCTELLNRANSVAPTCYSPLF